jgi:HSP20 family protein
MALQTWLPAFRGQWDPFAEMQDLQREMNRLFNVFSGRVGRAATLSEVAWTPAADIYETQDEWVAVLELPGVNHKEIDISLVGDTLTVRGERRREEQVGEENYYRIERNIGPFSRSLVLPSAVNAERIRATYRDGLLEIRLPKREEAKPKPIPIETA